MGKGQSKQTYNAATYGMIQQFQQDQQPDALEKEIKESFENVAQNGELYKDKFNEALICLEGFQVTQLRDTPLGQRLFYSFDTDHNGSVSLNEFMKGVKNLINDRETRIQYTFKAYDKDGDSKVSMKEFTEMFEESWKTAFRFVGQVVVKSGQQDVKMAEINQWAMDHVNNIRKFAEQEFYRYDSARRGFLDYMGFKQWVINQENKTIIAQYDRIRKEVPLTLMHIEGTPM